MGKCGQQKRSEFYDGKHSKVTLSSIGPTNLPQDALNFYYEDEGMYDDDGKDVDEMTMHSENGQMSSGKHRKKNQSKHDAKQWSKKHMQRLNEYETGGNLEMDLNIGNNAYNSFRNQMDKRGMISLHDKDFVPINRRR